MGVVSAVVVGSFVGRVVLCVWFYSISGYMYVCLVFTHSAAVCVCVDYVDSVVYVV